MAVYLVTGRLGSGKTLSVVGRLRDALQSGKRVATNLDLRLENLLPASARAVDVIRLPDKPSVADLDSLGLGTPGVDESKNGILVLDELGSWLNSREWADKTRQSVIDWLIHSRKKGWDVYLICQHISQIDKQVREALVEYLVTCRRLDRMRIPFLGVLLSLLTGGLVKGYMPKLHFGIVRYGVSPDAIVSERWLYTGTDLYQAYDTRQIFSAKYDKGVFSYLTPWHLKGRYERTFKQRMLDLWNGERPKAKRPPVSKLRPLLRLSPEIRWLAARQLVGKGIL